MATEKKILKPEIIHYNGLMYEITHDTKLMEKEIFNISTCGKQYTCYILFNEDRGKFQAKIEENQRVHSLSFFDKKEQARENIFLWISFSNGQINSQNSQSGGLGD